MESNVSKKNNRLKGKITKISLIVVIVFIIVWLGCTYYTGKKLEENSRELEKTPQHITNIVANLLELDTKQLPDLELRYLSHVRNFFSSDVLIGIYNNEKLTQDPIILEATLYHGPLPINRLIRLNIIPKLYSGDIVLEKNGSTQIFFDNTTTHTDPLIIHLTKNYGDGWDLLFKTTAIKYSNKGKEYSASNLTINGRAKSHKFFAQLSANHFNYNELATKKVNNLHVDNITFDVTINNFLNNTIGDPEITKLDGSIRGLKLKSDTQAKSIVYSKANFIQEDNKKYSLSFIIDDLLLEMDTENFSSKKISLDIEVKPSTAKKTHIKVEDMIVNNLSLGNIDWIQKGKIALQTAGHIDYFSFVNYLVNNNANIKDIIYLLSLSHYEQNLEWENSKEKSNLKLYYSLDEENILASPQNQLEWIDFVFLSLKQAEMNIFLSKSFINKLQGQDNTAPLTNEYFEENVATANKLLQQYIGNNITLLDDTTTHTEPDKHNNSVINFIINQKDQLISHILYKDNILTINGEKFKYVD